MAGLAALVVLIGCRDDSRSPLEPGPVRSEADTAAPGPLTFWQVSSGDGHTCGVTIKTGRTAGGQRARAAGRRQSSRVGHLPSVRASPVPAASRSSGSRAPLPKCQRRSQPHLRHRHGRQGVLLGLQRLGPARRRNDEPAHGADPRGRRAHLAPDQRGWLSHLRPDHRQHGVLLGAQHLRGAGRRHPGPATATHPGGRIAQVPDGRRGPGAQLRHQHHGRDVLLGQQPQPPG